MDNPATTPPDPLIELLTTYTELNSSSISELHEQPSALEFMRHVSLNRPFVVRKGAAEWEAVRTWNVSTLKEMLIGQSVNVAVTPNGKADAPTRVDVDVRGEDGRSEVLFVKPWEEQQNFGEFIDFMIEQEKSSEHSAASPQEVRYAQTQNDNLRNEYSTLFTQVQKDIPWARIALQNSPEAINLWIGNSKSVTALHKDNYENIYVQVLGKKHFVLLPPVVFPVVMERELVSAEWVRKEGGMEVRREEGDRVPFPTWDPDGEGAGGGENGEDREYEGLIEPMRVTLEPGDMLYLPALWYHKVSQSCSDEGICCAVNYWHDMEFSGSFYPLCNFVRSVSQSQQSQGVPKASS